MISRTNNHLKHVILMIMISFLFQSCTIYHTQSVKTQEAIESEYKVKIIMIDGRKMYFDQIKYEDDQLIGLSKIRNREIKVIIPREVIREIHLLDPRKSKFCTILLVGGFFGGMILISALNYEPHYFL